MSILNDLFGGGKIPAERATVTFGNSVFMIDGYRLLDNGEFRAGQDGSSLLIGFNKDWLSGVVTKRPKTLKALRGLGFSECQLDVKIVNDSKGREAKTISLDDLRILIEYAAFEVKTPSPKARQLARGLMGVSIREYFDATFIKDVKRLNRMNTEFERVLIAEENRRRELHQMPIEDAMNAPHDPGWQGSSPDNENRVYRNPWD